MMDGADDGCTPVSRNVTSVLAAQNLLPSEKQDPDADNLDEDTEDSATVQANDSPVPSLECPVCLQPCIHPVQLPCNHVFCFLCVKGVANRSKRCALCRQEIPLSYFHNPKLVRKEELLKNDAFEDGYQWFYEGRNGWWQYDERTSSELEEKYKKEEKNFELLIAGFLYVIDLDSMLQYRRNDPTRRRRIKRDLESIPEKKGVAGLRTMSNTANARQGAYGLETSQTAVKSTGQHGQHTNAGDGQGDHVSATGTPVCSPSAMSVPRNSPHDSQSPSDPLTSDASLSTAMGNLHITHGGDGRSTSPEHRLQHTGVQASHTCSAPQQDGQTGASSSQSDEQEPTQPGQIAPNLSSQNTQTCPQVTNSDGQSSPQAITLVGQMVQTSDSSTAQASPQVCQSVASKAGSPDRVRQRTPHRQATEGRSAPQRTPGTAVRNSQSSSGVTSPPRSVSASGSTSDSQVSRTSRQAVPGEARRAPRGAPRDQQKK